MSTTDERPAALQSVLGLLAGATMISFSGVFVKIASISPAMAGFYRMAFGAVVLLAVAAFQKIGLWRGWRHLAWQGLGGLLFALDLSLWHVSIHRVGPGLATILANFQAFFLAFYSMIVLKEKPSARLLCAIPIAMAGLVLIVGVGWGSLGPHYRQGIVFGLAAAFCYAAFLVVLRRAQSSAGAVHPMADLTVITVVTAVLIGGQHVGQPRAFVFPDMISLLAMIGYGVFSQVVGWSLIARSVAGVQTPVAGLLLLLQPALAFVWDVLVFKRPSGPTAVCGAVLALSAIYLGTTARPRS
jgi:drug/metabolite transporter (DMT)-like permease